MTLKNRITKLEKDAGGGDELPILVLKQDLDDDMLYRDDSKGIRVRRDSPAWAELAASHTILVIEYVKDWRGDDESEK